jgi:hypothetical protein
MSFVHSPLLRRLLAAAAVLLLAPSPTPAEATVAPPSPPVRFVLQDNFWVNLHHFLYVLGRAKNGERDAGREATVAAPGEVAAAGLTEPERRLWEECVAAYAAGLSKRDPIFDAGLARFTLALTRAPEDAVRPPIPGDEAAIAVLEKAAPLYRKYWYPSHRAENSRLISELTPIIDAHASALIARMERAYQKTWPREGVAIQVAGYTNWAGAYSTTGPLVVVASCPEVLHGDVGLEALLHESLHQWDQSMMGRIDAAAKRVGVPYPDGLDHAIIFYSTGHAARLEFGSGYRTYAELAGIWDRRLGIYLKVLEARWKPYLDGSGTLDSALDGVLTALR